MKKPARNLPDTNTIVRYLVNDDPGLFSRSKEFFETVKTGEAAAIILESVIAECVYVLTKIYKVPKDRVAQSLITLLRYKGIVNKDKLELVAALDCFARLNLDIVDCLLHAKATSGGDRVFTFDADLAKLNKRDFR